MKRLVFLLLWLIGVFLLAKNVPTWSIQTEYSDLLTPSSKAVLAKQKALRIEVFALPDSPAAALVNNFLQPLVGELVEVTVEYIDFFNNPKLIQTYGINKQGEMIVYSDEKKFHLSTLSYEAFFNGLKKIEQTEDQWIVFLDQIDGKSFDAGQSDGLNKWIKALSNSNYRSVVLPFSENMILPKEVKLIVLASPTLNFTDSHVDWLQLQISQGTSVLWLADPATALLQPGLSLLFDVMRTDAYHQGHLIIKAFPEHPVNQAFDRPLDFIEVMPYQTNNAVLWQNEQNQTLASTQEIDDSRLMVVGDSDFLSDAFLHSGGNLEMSFRLIDWLLHNDNRIDLPTIGSQGTQLHYQKNEILFFSGIMLILIPVILLVIGLIKWRKSK
ncbi:hypothetical protein [Marinicella litoralis]|nr:hypothetical protein [Marinicella litoralis]